MKEILEKITLIAKLHSAGLLSNQQGVELLNIASKKFLKNNDFSKSADIPKKAEMAQNAFFDSVSRKNLKDFLQNKLTGKENFDENKFIELIKNLENEAVSTHEKEKEFSQNLKNSNDVAKGKLTSQAEKTNATNPEPEHIFTRKEISKMSQKEFDKNEDLIMQQMMKGLISE